MAQFVCSFGFAFSRIHMVISISFFPFLSLFVFASQFIGHLLLFQIPYRCAMFGLKLLFIEIPKWSKINWKFTQREGNAPFSLLLSDQILIVSKFHEQILFKIKNQIKQLTVQVNCGFSFCKLTLLKVEKNLIRFTWSISGAVGIGLRLAT